MTNYEAARTLMKIYKNRYIISEEMDEGVHLTFHEVMDMNEIEVSVIKFEYDGNEQSGRYVIPHNGDFFVLNIHVHHRIDATWLKNNNNNVFTWKVEE